MLSIVERGIPVCGRSVRAVSRFALPGVDEVDGLLGVDRQALRRGLAVALGGVVRQVQDGVARRRRHLRRRSRPARRGVGSRSSSGPARTPAAARRPLDPPLARQLRPLLSPGHLDPAVGIELVRTVRTSTRPCPLSAAVATRSDGGGGKGVFAGEAAATDRAASSDANATRCPPSTPPGRPSPPAGNRLRRRGLSRLNPAGRGWRRRRPPRRRRAECRAVPGPPRARSSRRPRGSGEDRPGGRA